MPVHKLVNWLITIMITRPPGERSECGPGPNPESGWLPRFNSVYSPHLFIHQRLPGISLFKDTSTVKFFTKMQSVFREIWVKLWKTPHLAMRKNPWKNSSIRIQMRMASKFNQLFLVQSRDAESLFFCGTPTPTPGWENLGLPDSVCTRCFSSSVYFRTLLYTIVHF